jgi:hypothetical protein
VLPALPAKLFIAGRIAAWSELPGAALACLCSCLLSGYQRCTALVASLIVLLQIRRGFAPYHWSRVANPYSWIPSSGFLAPNRELGMLTFLGKCFLRTGDSAPAGGRLVFNRGGARSGAANGWH